MARSPLSKKQLAAIHAKGYKGGSNDNNLPPHLSTLLDTPEKRARADKIMADARFREREEMEGKGYVLKSGKWVYQPPTKRPNPTYTAYPKKGYVNVDGAQEPYNREKNGVKYTFVSAYGNKDDAVDIAKKRAKNIGHEWLVVQSGLGGDWIVYTGKKR